MKNMVKGVMIGAVILFLAACGSDKASTDGMGVVNEGEFSFASSGEFKPFSVTDANGVMSGFDIDVGNAVAEELGLEPVQKKMKFGSIVESVKAGRVDAAVASHTITEDRLEHVSFSTPYYYSGSQIFVRPDSSVEVLDDLDGLEIAVAKGTTYENDAKKVTDNIIFYDSDVTALEALSRGKHDAVITDFVTGKEAINAGMEIVGKELLGKSDQAIAVGKENEELLKKINEALETLRENGTLAKLSEKYFGDDITVNPEEE